MHISFAIAVTMESLYPQNTAGFTITYFTNIDQAIPLISLIISFITSSIGAKHTLLTTGLHSGNRTVQFSQQLK